MLYKSIPAIHFENSLKTLSNQVSHKAGAPVRKERQRRIIIL